MNLHPPRCILALLACWLALGLTAPGRGEGDFFPEKPAGLVADEAGVLLPERAAALNRDLLAAQRERGLAVYVVTIESLRVRPALRRQRLSELGHDYVERWAGQGIAMVLIYEDQSGEAAVIASRATDRQFPSLSRLMALSEPLRQIQQEKGLARDKTEATARAMLAGLSQLQDEARAAERRDRIGNRAMGAVVLVGVGLVLHWLWRREPAKVDRMPEGR